MEITFMRYVEAISVLSLEQSLIYDELAKENAKQFHSQTLDGERFFSPFGFFIIYEIEKRKEIKKISLLNEHFMQRRLFSLVLRDNLSLGKNFFLYYGNNF